MKVSDRGRQDRRKSKTVCKMRIGGIPREQPNGPAIAHAGAVEAPCLLIVRWTALAFRQVAE